MIIEFSRHAKRRSKLYKITEDVIREILRGMSLTDGEHEIIRDIAGFKYPIKIVVVAKNNIITVITNYPLKKGNKNDSAL